MIVEIVNDDFVQFVYSYFFRVVQFFFFDFWFFNGVEKFVFWVEYFYDIIFGV